MLMLSKTELNIKGELTMKIKTLSILLCIFTLFSVSACKKSEGSSNIIPLPVATPNPNISKPEGAFRTINGKPAATGGLSVLGTDFLKIMVEGKEVEFALSKDALKQIGYYIEDKDNPQIMKGTMLTIHYHEDDLIKIADEIVIVTAN